MKSMRHMEYKADKPLHQSIFRVFCIGTMIGLILSWGYLLVKGEAPFSVSTWEMIAFYPGFYVGIFCYEAFGGNIPLAELIGSICVGLVYGVALLLLHSLWILFAPIGKFASMGKYVMAILCILTIVLGAAFLISRFIIP